MSDKRILVVEDNDFVRMQIVKFLEDDGYVVVEATQGGDALQQMDSEEMDMAIVDLRMEPVDGFEFIRAIRGKNIQIPVILATGDNSPDILEQATTWDVGSVLIKPIEKDRLLKTVERTFKIWERRSS
ncbi:MAG: response regulator [Alphaproteobacteria bacterium]|nr:response regulator [Alphaproteobacteria bacterium]